MTQYKYTDQEFDPESGLYNYNARLYDPALGRFISADSVVQSSFNPQTLNRYSYVGNNPLINIDPTGESFFGIEFIIGAVIGAISAGSQSDWDLGQTLTGALIGGISGGVGGSTYGNDYGMTATIAGSSATNSLGWVMATGGESDFSISFGAFSYNFSQNDFGYLGKEGNSGLANLGYALGGLGNLYDLKVFDGLTLNTSRDSIGHPAIKEGDDSIVSVGPTGPPKRTYEKMVSAKGAPKHYAKLSLGVKGTNSYEIHGIDRMIRGGI